MKKKKQQTRLTPLNYARIENDTHISMGAVYIFVLIISLVVFSQIFILPDGMNALLILVIPIVIVFDIIIIGLFRRGQMDSPDCYVVFYDTIIDCRAQHNTDRMYDDYYYLFKNLNMNHNFGYIPISCVFHLKIGDALYLVKDPYSNKILRAYPVNNFFVDANDPKLRVLPAEQVKFHPKGFYGMELNEKNSYKPPFV